MALSTASYVQKGQLPIDKMISRWGCQFSEPILDFECEYFTIPEIEGFIGYRTFPGWAVVFGDPICAAENQYTLAQAFQKECQDKKVRVAYLIVSEKFSTWAIDNICSVRFEVGEDVIFNPQDDPCTGPKRWRLRNTISHPQHLGVTVEEYLTQDKKIEDAILQVGKTWVESRKGPQIHIGNLDFFTHRNNKRWFYVKHNNACIGMALLSRLEAHKGWFLKYMMTTPSAPRGSSELLMISILEQLKKENCHYLTYGMVPKSHLGEVKGLGPITTWLAKTAYLMINWYFRLENRRAYWNKFRPTTERLYILLDNAKFGLGEIYTILNALNIETRRK